MADERIDIQINDKVDPRIEQKILKVAVAAEKTGRAVERLKRQLDSVNATALNKLANASAKVTNALARETQANAKIMIAKARVKDINAKLAVSEQRLATEIQRTQAAINRANAVITAASNKTAESKAKVAVATKRATTEQKRAELVAVRLSNAYKRLSESGKKASFSMRSFAASAASFFALGISGRALIDFADSFTLIQNRLRVVTDTSSELATTTERVFDIAKRTRTGVLETARAFQRFDRALKNLGRSQEDSLRLTETINKSLIISGSTVGEASAGLLQLSQAFNKGKLDGDEFRTVMELMPTVADAIATELGVVTGELLNLAPQGRITGRVLADALDRVSKKVDRDFAKLAPTLAQGFTNLKTAAIDAFGEFEKRTGLFAAMARGVVLISSNLKTIIPLLAGLGVVITAAVLPSITVMIKALGGLALAILASPVGLILGALTAATAAFILFQDETSEAAKDLANFNDIADQASNTVRVLADAQADYNTAIQLNNPKDAVAALKEQDTAIKSLLSTLNKSSNLKFNEGGGSFLDALLGKDPQKKIKQLRADFSALGIDLDEFLTETKERVSVGPGVDVFNSIYTIDEDNFKRLKQAVITKSNELAGEIEKANAKVVAQNLENQRKLEAAISAGIETGDISGFDLTDEQKKNVETRLQYLKELNQGLDEQIKSLDGLNVSTEVQAELQKFINDLSKKGLEATNAEIKARAEQLALKEREAKLEAEVNGIKSNYIGVIEEQTIKQEALNMALGQGYLTMQQYRNEMTQLHLEQKRLMIELGEGGLGDALSSGLGQLVDGYKNVLTELTDAFGNFFDRVTDGFADSIGRAIVMGEDLEKSLKRVAQNALAEMISALVKIGIQYLVNAAIGKSAMASTAAVGAAAGAATAAAWAPAATMTSLASFGANAAPATAGMTTTYATAQTLAAAGGLAGFKDGGYTGNYGRSEVAGVVHGQEFVMNADATARNRPVLEAMNRGGSVGSSSTAMGVNITVENYGSSQISVEQVSPTDVRIIAKEAAMKAVREEAPGVIAADISNPNSRVSRSLNQNTKTERKR
jgi:tape measure domain-containing protein